MAFSFSNSIVPMSELRADPKRIKRKLKDSPVVITHKGKPDFGICDLDTLEIATRVQELYQLLEERVKNSASAQDVEAVFKELDQKYFGK